MIECKVATLSTFLGPVTVVETARGVRHVDLLDDGARQFAREAAGRFLRLPGEPECAQEFRDYFAGRLRAFTCPMDLVGTDFQRRCWLAVERSVPFGETITYAQEARLAFDSMTEGMKRICGLEEQIIKSLSLEDQDLSCELLTEMIEELETLLGYQDVSVKLNFGRSLMTIIRGINQIPGIRVKTSEAARRFEKLGQLNFNGDNLKYHVEFFSEMKIQRE